jgi:sugar phosphate isomerase/epimerase
MRLAERLDLSYCTNIHPAHGWDEVFANLRRYAPAVKQRVCPNLPFGIGLRLSDQESRQLATGTNLDRFADWLRKHDVYVGLINGFPFGTFHGEPVKEQVFAPDWRNPERLAYTLRLAEILSRLLPEQMDGGISTVPLSYSRWCDADRAKAFFTVTEALITAVEHLARLREERGVDLHIDIEPEPDGLLQTTRELVAFFREWLLEPGAAQLAGRLGVTKSRAADLVLHHLRACLDTCHMAVEFEGASDALVQLRTNCIRIGRVQVSAALDASLPTEASERDRVMAKLAEFYDPVYLHQTVAVGACGSCSFPDLPDAVNLLHDSELQSARVHYHVPLFAAEYGELRSTRQYTTEFLEQVVTQGLANHLEIETYTWSVLPTGLQKSLEDSICAEYEWVGQQLAPLLAPASREGMACRR